MGTNGDMGFNQDRNDSLEKVCKNCKAFVFGETPPDGFCALNPPQVVVQGDDIFSILPQVDGDKSFCLQFKLNKRDGRD